jgi:site-specific DNA recombinase
VPPIVSQALFLKVNGINRKKSVHNVKNENLPLKAFMTCASCKSPLTGFIVKAKGIYYYKCKTIGCSCNRNAEVLHTYFKELLSRYQIDKRFIEPLKLQLTHTLEYANKDNKNRIPLLKGKLKEVSKKIEKMQERYVIGEIEVDLYQKFKAKFSQEKEEIETEIKKSSSLSSNLTKYIDSALKLICNLHKIWELSDYTIKQKFQKMLFPNGIEYHRQNDVVQTFEINPILELIYNISTTYHNKKSGQIVNNSQLSAVVTAKGFEPPTLRAEI